jgi:hypothetical protein
MSGLPDDFPGGYGAFSLMINIFVCFPHPKPGQAVRESGREAYKDDGSDRCDWQPGRPSENPGSPLRAQDAIACRCRTGTYGDIRRGQYPKMGNPVI